MVIKQKFPPNKSPSPGGFTSEFFHPSLKTCCLSFCRLVQKVEETEILPNSFYEGKCYPDTKIETDHKRKKKGNDISAKILNKVLANPKHIKWNSSQGCQDSSTYQSI